MIATELLMYGAITLVSNMIRKKENEESKRSIFPVRERSRNSGSEPTDEMRHEDKGNEDTEEGYRGPTGRDMRF